jgi:hypothetical protein
MNERLGDLAAATPLIAEPPKSRGRLFRKYVALILAVVCLALLANGLSELWFSYQEHKASLIRIQREQAEAAAAKIGQFIKEIESQVGWTTQLPWSAGTIDQRRFDGLRLLRQVPAITELSQLDATGSEQLRVSRLAMDVVASKADLSKEPKFAEAVAHKVYYGPVYFRRESEPYMTLALAGTRRDAGVSVAEVNLKLIWDVVSQIKVGNRGHAYAWTIPWKTKWPCTAARAAALEPVAEVRASQRRCLMADAACTAECRPERLKGIRTRSSMVATWLKRLLSAERFPN